MTKCCDREKYFLIVDDLEHQRMAIKVAVQQVVPRSEFIEVGNLPEATEIVKGKDPIDIAIIDLMLTHEGKDEQGAELIRIMKKLPHRRNARSILITAYAGEESRVIADEVGADGYISKLNSSDVVELQETVKKFL